MLYCHIIMVKLIICDYVTIGINHVCCIVIYYGIYNRKFLHIQECYIRVYNAYSVYQICDVY